MENTDALQSSQCDGGDSRGSGETPVLREEMPSPDLTLHSDGPELEFRFQLCALGNPLSLLPHL